MFAYVAIMMRMNIEKGLKFLVDQLNDFQAKFSVGMEELRELVRHTEAHIDRTQSQLEEFIKESTKDSAQMKADIHASNNLLHALANSHIKLMNL